MRLIATLFVALGLAGVASPAFAQTCDTIVGWVGVPICQASASTIPVPDVVGEASSAAAETILVGDGLLLGAVTERCSTAADNEVVGQDPAPGTLVAAAEAVDLLVSNGMECSNGKTGVRLKGLRLRGL